MSVDGQPPIPLPEADSKAVKLSGRLNGQRLTFEILGNTEAADSMALYVYDRMNGLSQVDDAGLSGTLSLSHEPVVATLFLVDRRDDRIVSECTVVNTQKPELAISASDSVSAGGYVGYNLAGSEIGSDAVKIVRIVPAEQSSGPMAVEALLYASDLRSDLPFPVLSAGNTAQWGNDMAVWAGTARFRRFSLADVLHNDSTVYRYMPEFVMTLTGRAFRDSKFPMRDGSLVVLNGSNYYTYDTPVSHEGEFEIDVDDFAENTEFFMQYVDKAGKVKRADIRIPGDSYPPVEIYRGMARRNNRLRSSGIEIGEEVEGSHRLPDVVVKARATAEKDVSTKRFYAYKAKYREDIEKRHYGTLLDILYDLPTIRVTKELDLPEEGQEGQEGEILISRWKITTHRSIAMSKKETVRLLIDGSVNDDPDMLDLVFATPAIDIESVEYLSPYEAIALVPFAPAGAIMVTTRTLGSPVKRTSKGTIYRPPGLSPVLGKEQPRYIAPDEPGQYKLIVDVIDKNGIYSMEHPFTVAE